MKQNIFSDMSHRIILGYCDNSKDFLLLLGLNCCSFHQILLLFSSDTSFKEETKTLLNEHY